MCKIIFLLLEVSIQCVNAVDISLCHMLIDVVDIT